MVILMLIDNLFENIKGVIFDLDGTLLDSMKHFESTSFLTVDRFKIAMPDRKDFYGLAIHEMAEVMRDKYGATATVKEIVDFINSTVEDIFFNTVELKPNVAQFLQALYSRGVCMCIATLTDRYLVEAALKRLGVRHYFSEIFCCGEVGVGKTSPKVYDIALAQLGTSKQDTYIFEDSLYAIATAKKAGYKVVGIQDDSSQKYEAQIKELCDIYFDEYPLY